MKRDEALKPLQQHKAEMVERFGVKRLALFGSTARDEAQENSDVDILVDFVRPATFNGYFDLKFYAVPALLPHLVRLVEQHPAD